MIQIDHLSLRLGSQLVFEDLSLRVCRGEFVLLAGPSGSGKSTLARCLAGLAPGRIVAGRLRVAGQQVRQHPGCELARRVGLVFQNPATQLFNATVAEELAFGPRNLDLSAEQISQRVQWALTAVGIESLAGRSVRQLSGGEQQRVAIASVLAMQPELLILDEPLANLDSHGIRQVVDTLDRLHRELGLTILLIEHRLSAVLPLAQRVVLLQAGRVVADGPPAGLLADRPLWRDLGMGDSVLDGDAYCGGEGVLPITAPAAPLVSLEAVSAGYGRRRVLHNLDLALAPGSFVALVGDNGAGKSTIARLLAGVIRPTGGRVRWHPTLRRLPAGRRTGLLFQNPLHQLVCDRVIDEVSYGPRNYHQNGRLEPLLQAADLCSLQERSPHALSVGQQQRVALAAALALRPQLLILDEPTLGQDWGHLCQLMDHLSELHRHGQAILLITHDDRLVGRYAEQHVRLDCGRIVEQGLISPAESPVFHSPDFHKEQLS